MSKKSKANRELIENEIHRCLLDIDIESDEEYDKVVKRIELLYRLKEQSKPYTPSPDAVLAVLGNLLGLILIINHERAHVLSTKALGFVFKPKI